MWNSDDDNYADSCIRGGERDDLTLTSSIASALIEEDIEAPKLISKSKSKQWKSVCTATGKVTRTFYL